MRAIVRNTEQAQDFVRKLTFTGKPLQITVKAFKRDRTNPQNAKLHSMFRELALHTGHSETEIKDICKTQFSPRKEIKIGENNIIVAKGTSELNVEEMNEFIERVYALGADIGCGFYD